MDKDLSSTVTTTVVHSSSSYMMMSSPSCCFPIQNEFQYSRIHHFSNTCSCCCCCSSSSSTMKRRRGWRWRSILRRLMRESKTTLMCRSNKPVSFQYDPVSYSHNFDEGSFHLHHHHHQEPSQLVFQDHSGAVFHRLDSHCKI